MEEYFQIMNQHAYDLRQEAACYSWCYWKDYRLNIRTLNINSTNLYLVHIQALMSQFYIKIRLMYLYMLRPLYSHCNSPKCFSPQGAIIREYWYISWARSTKYMARYNYQIRQQCIISYVADTCIWTCIFFYLAHEMNQYSLRMAPRGLKNVVFHVNKVVLTYISALVKFLCKTNSTVCTLVPLKLQPQNMLHVVEIYIQNSNDTR
jgi:hypothetical protein